MTLYKLARTAKSKHIGSLYNNVVDINTARVKAGSGYHVYTLEGNINTGKLKWIMLVK